MPAKKINIGNVEITSLSDGILEFDLCNFFPEIPAEDWQPYHDYLTADEHVRFNLACFLIRSDGQTIAVDTGLGPKPADAPETPWGELLNDLAAQGLRPEDVDKVVMTHAHRDHIGWNVRSHDGKVVPTFPNAKYYLSGIDWDACHNPDLIESRFPNAPECLYPLEDMGILELIEGEYAITSELTTLPTPGHTPGHVSIAIASQGERAYILGDVAHSPAQAHYTDWCPIFDVEPDLSRKTRHQVLDMLEAQGILVSAGHFPDPGFGHFVKGETRRMWQGI